MILHDSYRLIFTSLSLLYFCNSGIYPIYPVLAVEEEPPRTGTPIGNSEPTGQKPEELCPNVDTSLVALSHNDHSDFTIQTDPTLWFYIPYNTNEIRHIRFTLLDKRGFKTIYKTDIRLLNQPGFISLQLPALVANSNNGDTVPTLAVDELYRWNFSLYCEGNTTDEPDRVVNGWIQRVPEVSNINSQENTYQNLSSNGIWYDAITVAASQRLTSCPEGNCTTEDNWTRLLQMLGREHLIDQPFVQSELLPIVDND